MAINGVVYGHRKVVRLRCNRCGEPTMHRLWSFLDGIAPLCRDCQRVMLRGLDRV